MQILSMTSRGQESTKLCGDVAVYITSIIMMLITILLMIEDRCNTSFAKNAWYVHMSFIIWDENGCKTNSVFYFKTIILYFIQITHTDDFPSTGSRLVILIIIIISLGQILLSYIANTSHTLMHARTYPRSMGR